MHNGDSGCLARYRGDGCMDILSASTNDNKIAWYANFVPHAYGPVLDGVTGTSFEKAVSTSCEGYSQSGNSFTFGKKSGTASSGVSYEKLMVPVGSLGVTAAELNKLSGDFTKADLEKMSGVTTLTEEFAILNSITASAADRNLIASSVVTLDENMTITVGNANISTLDVNGSLKINSSEVLSSTADLNLLHDSGLTNEDLLRFSGIDLPIGCDATYSSNNKTYSGTSCDDAAACQSKCTSSDACEGYSFQKNAYYEGELKTVPGSSIWFFNSEGNNGHFHDGNFYAISSYSIDRHILKLSADGTFDRTWLNYKTAFGEDLETYGFTGDAIGNLYVATWLKIFKIDIATKTATAIKTDTNARMSSLAVSVDGKYVFYSRYDTSNPKHDLYQLDTTNSQSTKIVDTVVPSNGKVYAMQFVNDNLYYSTKSCYNCDTVGTISKLTKVGAAFVDLASVQKTDYTTTYDVGKTRFNFDVDTTGNFYILDKDGVMHKHAPDFTEVDSAIGGFDASTCQKRLDNNGFVHVSGNVIYTKPVSDDSSNANGCYNFDNLRVMVILSAKDTYTYGAVLDGVTGTSFEKSIDLSSCRPRAFELNIMDGFSGSTADLEMLHTPIFVKQLALGQNHGCSLQSDGLVKCWGQATYGQLGSGDTNNRGDGPNEMGSNLPFVDLGTGKTAKEIVAGVLYTCAILNDDTLKCWGINEGQLGYGDSDVRGDNINEMGDNLPLVDLGTGKTVKQVATGEKHTCAILNDDTVKCWGNADLQDNSGMEIQ